MCQGRAAPAKRNRPQHGQSGHSEIGLAKALSATHPATRRQSIKQCAQARSRYHRRPLPQWQHPAHLQRARRSCRRPSGCRGFPDKLSARALRQRYLSTWAAIECRYLQLHATLRFGCSLQLGRTLHSGHSPGWDGAARPERTPTASSVSQPNVTAGRRCAGSADHSHAARRRGAGERVGCGWLARNRSDPWPAFCSEHSQRLRLVPTHYFGRLHVPLTLG